MITTKNQYIATKRSLEEMRSSWNSLKEIDYIKVGIDPVLIEAQRESVRQMIEDLERQLKFYDEASSGALSEISLDSLEELGGRLIAARLSNGWTQRELAERLGMKEQQVQRYEKERYASASLDRLVDISRVLEVSLSGKIKRNLAGSNDHSSSLNDLLRKIDVNCFPMKELRKRKWLEYDPKEVRSTDDIIGVLSKYFSDANLQAVSPMLHRRTDRVLNESSICSLLAWQAHVKKSAKQKAVGLPDFKHLGLDFIREIVELSNYEDGPIRAVNAVQNAGIVVVIAPHLQHTLLDGAAMLMDDGRPVIGLTLRQDRLDNFWFVLFHELGHISKHRYSGLVEGFLDENDGDSMDVREREANDFARNALISDEVWKRSFVRYANSTDDIIAFAKNVGVGPEIVAGRIRFERNDFSILNKLVGRGKLRRMFKMAGMSDDL